MRKAWNPSEVEERLNPDGSVQIIPVEVEEVVLSWDEEQPPTALHDIAHRAKVRKFSIFTCGEVRARRSRDDKKSVGGAGVVVCPELLSKEEVELWFCPELLSQTMVNGKK